jgi:hypothetical protein
MDANGHQLEFFEQASFLKTDGSCRVGDDIVVWQEFHLISFSIEENCI